MSRMIVPVMGPTCAGKSTLMKYIREQHLAEVGLVEVGRMLRAKYPPEFFQGQAAPTHTQQEAWQLCDDTVKQYLEEGKRLIFIDGQPRDMLQFETMTSGTWLPEDTQMWFVMLYASREAREHRARTSRTEGDLDLALARMKTDLQIYGEITPLIHFLNLPFTVYRTDHPGYAPSHVLNFFHSFCGIRS